MRTDAIGLFWEDRPAARGRERIARVMPPIPDTGWTPPRDFPNLSGARVLALDTETKDPELKEHGPGWARNKGHVIGVSIATHDASWYFPVRHEIEPEHNMDPDKVFAWLRDTLADPHVPKVGANLLYDLGWLRHEGVEVRGPLHDVQYAEALLNEAAPVDLDALGSKYLGIGKETSLLYQWCADYYGGPVSGKQRANLYRAPPRLVGPYAEGDATLPLQVLAHQWRALAREELLHLFSMECRLIPLLLEMRWRGVRVDVDRAQQASDAIAKRTELIQARLNELAGFQVSVNNANDSLTRLFDQFGLSYGRTPTGKPSFTKDTLAGTDHPAVALVQEIRKLEKLRGTFIESYILGANVDGRVYCSFHPLRGESGGTRSGRFSSSNPNLQNVPSRDEELAPLIRGFFVPDEGCVGWRKYDYSQIEYRFLLEFAVGPGADEIREYFRAHPDTDYHDRVIQQIREKTGRTLDRKPAKNINFGLIYGMGIPKLTHSLGLGKKEGKELFEAYHLGVPFAKPTMEQASMEAETLGYVTTILGRRSRFDLWEPATYGRDAIALPYEKACAYYGRVRRAYVHKALNRRLQGSAAELMKVAMLKCWEDGVFAETGIPALTVHDELDFSDPGGKDEAFNEMQHIMETAIPGLKVPVRADFEFGPDWGHVA